MDNLEGALVSGTCGAAALAPRPCDDGTLGVDETCSDPAECGWGERPVGAYPDCVAPGEFLCPVGQIQ
jgi:hypothetical protein